MVQHARTMSDLKLAFTEFYLSLVLLTNYQSLNFTAFRKILKKHDKIFNRTSGAEYHVKRIACSEFHNSKKIAVMISQCEETYINDLEGPC